MEEVAEAPAAQPMEVKPPVVLEQPPTEAMEVEQQTQQHQQQPSPQKQIQREPETPPQHHPEFEQDEGMEFKNNIRGGFRGRPWNMGGGPPRFRGRGFGPGGPGPMRGRGGPGPFFRGRGGPQGGRFPGPNFDPNWGPNNMGGPGFNPPGFGNPPLELWVETKSEDGKSYFYHAISRETTWTRPEGPNIKIMTQADVEAMNARNQQQQPPQQQQQPQQHPPPQQQQPQQQQPPNQAASENSAKEPQQANANGNGSQIPPNKTPPVIKEGEISESAPNSVPVNNGIAKPVEPIPTSMPPPMQQPPAFFPGAPPHFGAPPFGMPPPGYGGYPPGAWGVPWGVPNAHMQEPPAKNLIIKPGVIDPAVIARAAEWSEHRAPDGRPYYYHAGRGESVWEKPQAIRDLEAARMAAHSGATPQSIAAQTSGTTTVAIGQAPIMSPAINMGPGTPFDPMAFAPKPGDPNLMKMEANELAERDKKKKEQEKKKKEEEEKNKQANKPQDKSRPISSTPIAGTPWCVVWTGDGRVFFYNPSTRTSVWERPEDLLARADVDKAVSTPPEQLLGTLEKEKKPETQPPIEISTNKVEIESITEDEAPNKKLKLSVNEGKPVEKKVDVAKEAAIEAEVRAAKERALVPLDVRVKSFKEMLKEKDVST